MFFTNYEGRYYESLRTDSFSGNGWQGRVEQDGSLHLEATREYSDGPHSIACDIQPNGKYTVTQNGEVTKKGRYKLTEGKLNGEFRLPGGNIDDRYIAYRDAEFAQFLKDRGITAVKHQEPNQEFYQRDAYHGNGRTDSAIFTDGQVEYGEYNDERSEDWQHGLNGKNSNLSMGHSYDNVTGANWAIVCQSQHERDNHNYSVILYTKQNPMQIAGLPAIEYNNGFVATQAKQTPLEINRDRLKAMEEFEAEGNVHFLDDGQSFDDSIRSNCANNDVVVYQEKTKNGDPQYAITLGGAHFSHGYATEEYIPDSETLKRNLAALSVLEKEMQDPNGMFYKLADYTEHAGSMTYITGKDSAIATNLSDGESIIGPSSHFEESVRVKKNVYKVKDAYAERAREIHGAYFALGFADHNLGNTLSIKFDAETFPETKKITDFFDRAVGKDSWRGGPQKDLLPESLDKQQLSNELNLIKQTIQDQKTKLDLNNSLGITSGNLTFTSKESAERFLDNGCKTGYAPYDKILSAGEFRSKGGIDDLHQATKQWTEERAQEKTVVKEQENSEIKSRARKAFGYRAGNGAHKPPVNKQKTEQNAQPMKQKGI